MTIQTKNAEDRPKILEWIQYMARTLDRQIVRSKFRPIVDGLKLGETLTKEMSDDIGDLFAEWTGVDNPRPKFASDVMLCIMILGGYIRVLGIRSDGSPEIMEMANGEPMPGQESK